VNEIVFEVTQDADGGYSAECLTESILTQGDTWDALRANVRKLFQRSTSIVRSLPLSGFISSTMKCSLSDENSA
jgi:hypothetical protein